jgi:GNAT superfamily N-acetyltransferase
MPIWVRRSGLVLLWAIYDGYVRADPHAAFVAHPSTPKSWTNHCSKSDVPPAPIQTNRSRPLSLFFHTNVRGERGRNKRWTAPAEALDRLSQPSVSLPASIELKYEGKAPPENEPSSKRLVIRNIEKNDLPVLIAMCVKEFGSTSEVIDFPWKNLNMNSIQEWFDSVLFGPLIGMSLEMKIQRQGSTSEEPDYNIVCLEENGEIVGIVELSIQPLDPERNPPPVPFPIWYKEAYSTSKGLPPPNGFVTNLLIADQHRGKGYSKVMMKAVEGLARSWGCTSISLHVDADPTSGEIAQALYKSLGYEPVSSDATKDKFDWMGPEFQLRSGLYMIEGVALLFLRKSLEKEDHETARY